MKSNRNIVSCTILFDEKYKLCVPSEISRYEVLFDEKYKLCVPSVSVLINRMADKNKQKVAQSKSMSVRATSSPLPLNPTGGEIDKQRNLCRVKTKDVTGVSRENQCTIVLYHSTLDESVTFHNNLSL